MLLRDFSVKNNYDYADFTSSLNGAKALWFVEISYAGIAPIHCRQF